MSDATVRKGLALWVAGFAVLALFGGAALSLLAFGVGRSPAATDDLRVSNDDDANHTVRIEVVAANGSSEATVFERQVTLEPNESVRFDPGTEAGETYRLDVTVDDRGPESFEISGPDDYCTTELYLEADATVETVLSCA